MSPRTRGRSRLTRPVRRARRWARHTPNGQIALTLLTIGGVLILVAVVLAFTVL